MLRGERRGDTIDFGAFTVPAVSLQGGAPVAKIECSLRPQAIALKAQRPADAGAVSFAGKVAARSFLGDTWEYVIQSNEGGLRVRAMSSAPQLLAAGDPVWLEIDPRNLVPLGV